MRPIILIPRSTSGVNPSVEKTNIERRTRYTSRPSGDYSSGTSMTDSSESHQEASAPTSLLRRRQPFKMGFWNVRTLLQTRKLSQACKEMDNYALDVLGGSECRWPGSGIMKMTQMVHIFGHRERWTEWSWDDSKQNS